MSTFGERLRAALLANGVTTLPEQVAFPVRTAKIDRREAKRWLEMREARVPAMCLAPVTHALNFRMYWFCTGEGIPQVLRTLMEEERVAVTLVMDLTESGRQQFLTYGQRLLRA